ncbi:hypothetical protein GQR36_25965 [Enterococcus termitis]
MRGCLDHKNNWLKRGENNEKVNFVIVVLLLIVFVLFVTFLNQMYSFLDSIAYIIIPSEEEEYISADSINRDLIRTIPMMFITGVTAILAYKKDYN